MSSWRPMLRLAWRDARRHLSRTLLAALLIAVPVAALTAFVSVTDPGAPPRERVLAGLPDGAQALITTTAIPQGGPSFPQLPEGAPGPWVDDPETTPASRDQIASVLSVDVELAEFWHSPPLVASPDLSLAPGEQRTIVAQADALSATSLTHLAMVELRESEPAAFALMAPAPVDGAAPKSPDEVLVSRALADRLGVTVGGTLGLVAPPDSGVRGTDGNAAAAMQDSARGYRVSGIADSEEYLAWAPAGWLSELVSANPEGVQGHWLVLGNDPVTWEQAKALNAAQAFAVSRQVLEQYPSSDQLYPVEIDPARYLQGALGVVLALIVGGMLMLFLVTPALAISAEQSRRSLGLAAAAGATPKDLRRVVLAQGLVLGLLGGVLGAVLSVAASLGFGAWLGALEVRNGVVNPSYGLDVALAHFPWWALVAGVAVALLLGLIAALGPARSVANLVPVDALREHGPARALVRRSRVALRIGPALIAIGVALGALTLLVPVPSYPTGPDVTQYFPPGTPPPGSGTLILLVAVAVIATAIGLAITLHGGVPMLARIGKRSRPLWRLAVRDTADHPSRTVPAILGVTFSLLAASYLVVIGASAHADEGNTGETLGWRGAFMASPRVSISPEFDRALAAGAIAELSRTMPQIAGSHPVEGVASDSAVWIEPLLPEGHECPGQEQVSAESARALGAPIRCVGPLSRAAFQTNFRFGGPFGTWNPPILMDGEAIRATRLPGAEDGRQVLDAGGVITSNAALIDAEGMIRLAVGPKASAGQAFVEPESEVRLPAMFLRGVGAGLVMSADTAHELGVDRIDLVGLLAETIPPLNDQELTHLHEQDTGDLVWINVPDTQDPLGASTDAAGKALVWGPVVLLSLVAVAATAISVLLSTAQGRRDAATAHAVGATRATLTLFGLARAGVILVIGIPVGIAAGVALGAYQVAWNRHLAASGAWLDTVPVWGVQGLIAVGVALAALVAAMVVSRPPRVIGRRGLD